MTSDETSPPPASIFVGREFAAVSPPIVPAQGLVEFSTMPADPIRLLAAISAELSMIAFSCSPVFLLRTCQVPMDC